MTSRVDLAGCRITTRPPRAVNCKGKILTEPRVPVSLGTASSFVSSQKNMPWCRESLQGESDQLRKPKRRQILNHSPAYLSESQRGWAKARSIGACLLSSRLQAATPPHPAHNLACVQQAGDPARVPSPEDRGGQEFFLGREHQRQYSQTRKVGGSASPKPQHFSRPTELTTEALLSMQKSEVAQSCPTLCDPLDCSLSGSSVHGIFQARVLEWIAISFSRGSSRPRNRTQVSCIAGTFFTD